MELSISSEVLLNSKKVSQLLEWVGENNITYDGYKLWKRNLNIKDESEDEKQEYYNTQQLIEQFLKEN